ncbi:hypothetical protein I2494_16200 [Budviciaceae bacterium BWR-B9]|uniref:Conjugal transfer protein TrbI n=1 Tax=Limnobaculum allomyrinae TaxID=2791986 RepID=A0ABS1ITZ4_9GAMM|nr:MULTISPECIES: hypothetical protein [Limnobaculum]MBK5145229.1 hypothetical protein [Limnobaculum allomyrinae]MBV7693061.1 hypothetical protein [Limnobaculum sp. M2-1]
MSAISLTAYRNQRNQRNQTNQRTNDRVRITAAPMSYFRLGLYIVAGSIGASLLIVAGTFGHMYWQYLYPKPIEVQTSVPAPVAPKEQPEIFLSDMHYLYTTKPLPQPQAPSPLTTMDNLNQPLVDRDVIRGEPEGDIPLAPMNNKARAPVSDDSSESEATRNLRERLAQALQEQSREYNSDIPQVTTEPQKK